MGEEEIVDLGNHPVIYADGLPEGVVYGYVARLRFTARQEYAGKTCRVVVCELIRPLGEVAHLAPILRHPGQEAEIVVVH